MSEVTVNIGGASFRGWSSYSIQRSMETLSSSFNMSVTDSKKKNNNLDWPLQTQLPTNIKYGDKYLINGYIDSVSPSITANEHSIGIRGRDKTSDLVDCSAKESARNFSFNKVNILQLAKALSEPYGISVKVSPGSKVTDTFKVNINASETVFDVLDKKARELSLLITTDNRGNLIIGNSTREKAFDKLVLGENILAGNGNYNYGDRFSEYKVIGQSSAGSAWSANISINASSVDEGVSRFRPLLLQGSGNMNRTRAQKKANWEANTRAAKSQEIEITVQGHLQSNGDLWEPNKLVQVLAPELYINPATELLITSVNYKLDEEGTKTTLSLKREDAYEIEPIEKVKPKKKVGW